MKSLPQVFEKVSLLLKSIQTFFFGHVHAHVHVNMDTNTDPITSARTSICRVMHHNREREKIGQLLHSYAAIYIYNEHYQGSSALGGFRLKQCI